MPSCMTSPFPVINKSTLWEGHNTTQDPQSSDPPSSSLPFEREESWCGEVAAVHPVPTLPSLYCTLVPLHLAVLSSSVDLSSLKATNHSRS